MPVGQLDKTTRVGNRHARSLQVPTLETSDVNHRSESLAVPFVHRCGPFAVPRAGTDENGRSRTPMFSRLSPAFAASCKVLNLRLSSGSKGRLGFSMRFSRLLRSFAVPSPRICHVVRTNTAGRLPREGCDVQARLLGIPGHRRALVRAGFSPRRRLRVAQDFTPSRPGSLRS
jgi:hypothetical protein